MKAYIFFAMLSNRLEDIWKVELKLSMFTIMMLLLPAMHHPLVIHRYMLDMCWAGRMLTEDLPVVQNGGEIDGLHE
jgi:hypothetical protein